MYKPGTKEYHAVKSREHYQRQSDEWKAERSKYRTIKRREKKANAVIFFGSKCAHCNHSFPDCVYEFHHINHSEKDVTPSKLFLLTDERIYTELAKCIMLCANCHRLVHHADEYKSHTKRKYLKGKYGS
jgi:predicted HNH restriction endonuclease